LFFVIYHTLQIERDVAYGKTKEDLGKWDPIVVKNRTVSITIVFNSKEYYYPSS